MSRRMTSVTEIIKLDSDTNQLIFMAPYTWLSKTDDRFEGTGSSKILNRIKAQNDWSDEQLQEEIENRMTILEWMRKKNIHGYKEFGAVINEYRKFPQQVLELARKELAE
jgi:archaeal flagellar protein FlaI